MRQLILTAALVALGAVLPACDCGAPPANDAGIGGGSGGGGGGGGGGAQDAGTGGGGGTEDGGTGGGGGTAMTYRPATDVLSGAGRVSGGGRTVDVQVGTGIQRFTVSGGGYTVRVEAAINP